MSIVKQLQQQINEAEAKVNALRQKLEEERNNERTQAIASAKELIKAHNLTPLELGFSAKKPIRRVTPVDKRVTVAPKYKDPATGKTWTGRGKTPAWLAALVANGHTKQDYLIK